MAFPRLTPLAEVAWSPAQSKEYKGFLERLRTDEQRLESIGVNFRKLGK